MGWHGIIHGGITSGIIDDLFAQYCHIEAPELFALTKMLQVHFLKPAFPDEVLFARITKTSLERSDDGDRNKRLWVQGHIDAFRNNDFITVAKAEALFVLCKQLPEQPKVGSLLPRERAFERMPQELWKMVIEYLPSLSGRYVAEVFGFKLEERHQKHADVWHSMFREKDTWTLIAIRQGLNPFVVGDGLHTLYNDPKQPAYLCLLTGDKTRNIRHDKMKLLTSLREHHFNENGEVVFHDSKIILNIEEALYNPFFITSTPEKLFSCQKNRLRSASLYYTDSQYALQEIGPGNIIGIRQQVSTFARCIFYMWHYSETPKRDVIKAKASAVFSASKLPTYISSLSHRVQIQWGQHPWVGVGE
jgi:hypothetical protein